MTKLRGGALVFVAIVLISLNLRTAIMGFVPVLDVIGADIGFGATAAGVLATVPTFVFGVIALAGPMLFRLAGGELLLTISAAATTVGIVTRSFSDDVWTLAVTFMIAVAGIGIANVVLVPVIKQYFSHRLGLMNGLYIAGMQIGPIIAPVVVAVMIENNAGWRLATGIWALPAVAALAVWAVQTVIVRRAHLNPATGPIEQVEPEPRIRFSLLVRSPLAWGIMGVFSMNSLISYTMNALLASRFVDVGTSLTFGSSMLSILSLLGTVGSLIVPALTTRIRSPFLLIVVFDALLLIGFVGLLFSPMSMPIVWVACVGIGLNCFPLALTLMNLRSRTRAGSAGLSGFGQGVGYLIASVGPFGVGLARSATGDWTLPFVLLILTLPVSVVCGWFGTRKRHIEDEAPQAA